MNIKKKELKNKKRAIIKELRKRNKVIVKNLAGFVIIMIMLSFVFLYCLSLGFDAYESLEDRTFVIVMSVLLLFPTVLLIYMIVSNKNK